MLIELLFGEKPPTFWGSSTLIFGDWNSKGGSSLFESYPGSLQRVFVHMLGLSQQFRRQLKLIKTLQHVRLSRSLKQIGICRVLVLATEKTGVPKALNIFVQT